MGYLNKQQTAFHTNTITRPTSWRQLRYLSASFPLHSRLIPSQTKTEGANCFLATPSWRFASARQSLLSQFLQVCPWLYVARHRKPKTLDNSSTDGSRWNTSGLSPLARFGIGQVVQRLVQMIYLPRRNLDSDGRVITLHFQFGDGLQLWCN